MVEVTQGLETLRLSLRLDLRVRRTCWLWGTTGPNSLVHGNARQSLDLVRPRKGSAQELSRVHKTLVCLQAR